MQRKARNSHNLFAILLRHFPQTKIVIAGQDPFKLPLWSVKRLVGYPLYLRHLIRKYGLRGHVEFTGVLNSKSMMERMVRSNVFLMSSMIENSPNTLGEAMILGLPVVSAYAGGAPSMAADETEALFYRPDDSAMLAPQIRRIFEDDALAVQLSRAAQARAVVTHDPDSNLQDLIDVYKVIMETKMAIV